VLRAIVGAEITRPRQRALRRTFAQRDANRRDPAQEGAERSKPNTVNLVSGGRVIVLVCRGLGSVSLSLIRG
jgi:hypothetical protein